MYGKLPVFALCAPAGRAAQRMKETTSRNAQTIHKLIEYQPFDGKEYYILLLMDILLPTEAVGVLVRDHQKAILLERQKVILPDRELLTVKAMVLPMELHRDFHIQMAKAAVKVIVWDKAIVHRLDMAAVKVPATGKMPALLQARM